MKITDEAKELLNEFFATNNADCLKAVLQSTCCGTTATFTLSKLQDTDRPIMVNGVPVLIDDSVQNQIKTITIKSDNGELIIDDDEASTGCC